MKKIKIGIIGCGTIANCSHIPSYLKNENVEIVYFCDIKLQRAEEAVEKYGIGVAVIDYKTVLEDKSIDAISVCTPNNLHSQVSIAALEAGKHVLCEKPVARTLQEAIEMQKKQRETGKILNIGVVNRFNSAVNKIKELIDNGELGEVYHVYVSFRARRAIPGLGGAFTTKEIAGGGVLIDWGVHYLDIVMYCTSDPKPLTVSAKAYSKLGKNIQDYVYEDMWAGPPIEDGIYDVEDFVSGFVRTNGPTISFNGAWAQNIGQNEMFIDFLGDKAGIRLSYGGDFIVYKTIDNKLSQEQFSFGENDMFQNEIDSFVDCVINNKNNLSHIDTAIITASIMQAIYDSSKEGKEINLQG